jgi:glycosyltransferase involved in cell wall biosynthesis
MKVLFLPGNIASIPANTARGINRLVGVSAKCLIISSHKYHDSDESVIELPDKGSKKNIFRWVYRYIKNLWAIKQLIDEADILHYMGGTSVYGGLDLKWAHYQKKAIFIEWMGSEIRNPAFLFPINKYYKTAFENGYEYKAAESSNNKTKVQQMFHKAGAVAIACPEISMFIDRNLFPQVTLLFQRLNVRDFIPLYKPNNKRPLLLHSPSAQKAKGTRIISDTIDRLKNKYDFDFILLHDVSRNEVLTLMKQADIFIDQIILGGHGMAALEAMAFGKPVMCYLIPEVFEAGLPAECPIVNTNPDNIEEELEKLLKDANLRSKIGVQSRIYVERYHDADKIGLQLIELYKKELEKFN